MLILDFILGLSSLILVIFQEWQMACIFLILEVMVIRLDKYNNKK